MKMNYDKEYIFKKCKEHTLLSDEEIEKILDITKTLSYFNQAMDSEAFIDIKAHNKDVAIVVAESFRENSIYCNSYLGDIIYRENEPAVFRTFDLGVMTTDLIGVSYDKEKNKIFTRQTVLPIKHNDSVVATLILEKALDYTNNKPIIAEIKKPSEKVDITEILLSIIGFSSENEDMQIREGILVFDVNGLLIYHNKYADIIYKKLGYHTIETLHFDNLNFSSKRFNDLFSKTQDEGDDKNQILTKKYKPYEEKIAIGDKYYIVRIVITEHLQIKVLVFIDDITEIRKYEDEVHNYLVTYQEIHHRIKNNLQTVASLLRLQSRNSKDKSVKAILSDSINRVLSIAVTHELLARKNGNQVGILEVLNQIKRSMMINDVSDETQIGITIKGDDFYLDSEKSSVVALIVNELLQNSIKYAFSGRSEGKIDITTTSDKDIKIIEVRDDGVGYDPNCSKKDSLGLTIVKTYVNEKLTGKLIIKSGDEGTATSFAFKL